MKNHILSTTLYVTADDKSMKISEKNDNEPATEAEARRILDENEVKSSENS